jgi:hypothetical protein
MVKVQKRNSGSWRRRLRVERKVRGFKGRIRETGHDDSQSLEGMEEIVMMDILFSSSTSFFSFASIL